MDHVLLFLDVDGPLIPFGGVVREYSTGGAGSGGNPLLGRVDPGHGRRLAALGCELVWATTWMDEANECIAPLIGLPPFAVVEWPGPSEQEMEDVAAGLHWKTRPLVEWAAGRPFVWVDDELTGADREWVAVHHPGRALLHRVDAAVGLTEGDYEVLGEWLAQVRSGG